MKTEIMNAIVNTVYTINGDAKGLEAFNKITKELDCLMERERMLIHALNALWECSKEAWAWYDLDTDIHNEMEKALKQADKLLAGN